jgi:hypothetical protein
MTAASNPTHSQGQRGLAYRHRTHHQRDTTRETRARYTAKSPIAIGVTMTMRFDQE